MGPLATGVGSMPGTDDVAYAEAVRVVLGELGTPGGLPFVPEVPGRGPGSTMTGRTLAVVSGLAVDLQPAGWRLTTSTPGVDQRRARSQLAQDLDCVEEQAQGYEGAFKAQLAGPWTLAATVERPRGDKLLADHGARRELAQALAEGVGEHVADLRRRLPGVDRLVVQVDEPVLPAVLAGAVPTASGHGRHRSVEAVEARTALGWVLDAVVDAGAEPWVHSCAPDMPWAAVRDAGATGLVVDAGVLTPTELDAAAAALEAGESIVVGVLPTSAPAAGLADTAVVERVRRWLDVVGLDAEELGDRLLLGPACGLAGADSSWARRALTLAASAARALSDG